MLFFYFSHTEQTLCTLCLVVCSVGGGVHLISPYRVQLVSHVADTVIVAAAIQ